MTIGRPNSIDASNALAAAGQPVQSSRSPEQVAKDRELIKAVRALDSTELFGSNSELTFVFDRKIQRALVRVIDRNTQEVIMQLPAEYVVRMAEENQTK
jgi:uncharacterized FlaG/YvyC family protein